MRECVMRLAGLDMMEKEMDGRMDKQTRRNERWKVSDMLL